MTEEIKPDLVKVEKIGQIDLDSFVNSTIYIRYRGSGSYRKEYTADLLGHDESYVYMGSGNNHSACCKMSELHWLGRLINGVHRFKKSNVDTITTLEAKVVYEIYSVDC